MLHHAFGSNVSLSLSGEAGENLKSQGKVDFLINGAESTGKSFGKSLN